MSSSSNSRKRSRLSDEELDYMASPVGFAEKVLGMKLYPKQAETLAALAPEGSAVVGRFNNEGGKTSRVIVAAILWHLKLMKGKVVSTSGAARQIESQLVPYLHRYRDKFPDWRFMKIPKIETTDPNCFYEGFTTNDAGKFEGYHGESSEEPLLIIVDEAKTVPDYVYESIERCKPHRLLILSSPGDPEGEFYYAFNKRKDSYSAHIVQTAFDCPHITKEQIDKTERKWGRDHPLVRSMIYAEFMENVSDAIIKLKHLEACMLTPPPYAKGERKAFCDFAAGGDENVLAVRDGNKVEIVDAWRDKDTMAACGRFSMWFHRLALKPDEIEGDAAGMGMPFINRLTEMGWPISPYYASSAATDSAHFANSVAERWVEAARKIELGQVILPPNDEDLKGQLLSRKTIPTKLGKIQLESKDDMRRRGLPSPDRADAVIGALAPKAGFSAVQFTEVRESWLEDNDNEEACAGFSC